MLDYRHRWAAVETRHSHGEIIATDPAPPARARIWWTRGDSPAATQACRNEFGSRARDDRARL